MSDKIIIADAGPLIAFGRVKSLQLLFNTLGKVIVPKAVLFECTQNTNFPGAQRVFYYLLKRKN